MPARSPSPAASEREYDITEALVPDAGSTDSDDGFVDHRHPERKAQMGQEEMPDLAADSGSDDADFIADAQATSNRKSSNAKGRTVKKGGGFQAMGLNANLLKAITRKGFSVPTPIQRKAIPMVLDGRDVVGMARTGSGKTAAFVIPMIEKLKAHSARIGSRAVVLSPSRELALQTLKVVKELGRGTDLKCVLLVGGDSLEEQFTLMAGNPDIVIATPGRFLHLQVEMKLDLSSVRYVVFDEADRLFEMGFAAQLTEILHALPPSRQTLLFSATLPKSLVEFAKAGLHDPNLVRLDADSKVSPDLQSAFFTLKSAEKEGALLHILNDIIQMPTGDTEASKQRKDASNKPSQESKKRKRSEFENVKAKESPTEHSTIIFTATKHHVEYIATFLRLAGFAVSYAYGSLDQTARKIQVQDFRTGMTNILVVTDVAARGIDIPILANVINYDFPPQPKVFVHRVGRTARAGQTGWSYSLVRESDAPYLLDLQLFLGRKLVLGREEDQSVNFAQDVAVGSFTREGLERNCESAAKRLAEDDDLRVLQSVAAKGEKLYLRTRNAASIQSARQAKEIVGSGGWMTLHPLFDDDTNNAEMEREKMLARVSGFRPPESVFEFGKKGSQSETAEIMKKRRKIITAQKARTDTQKFSNEEQENIPPAPAQPEVASSSSTLREDTPSSVASELEVSISNTVQPPDPTSTFQDPSHFMSYTPASLNPYEERAYGVHSGSTSHKSNGDFLQAAASQTLNLTADDGKSFAEPARARGLRWDKKSKRYVARANDEDGSRAKGAGKLVVGEGGTKIAASFRSGRFDAWRKKNRVARMPRVGDMEKGGNTPLPGGGYGGVGGGDGEKRWKHQSVKAPKDADKYRDDFYKKKKMVEKAKEAKVGRFSDVGKKGEVRSWEGVRKVRREEERKKARGGGSRGRGGGRGGSRGRGRGRV